MLHTKRYRRFLLLLGILILTLGAVFYVKVQYVVPIIMYHKIDYDGNLTKLSVTQESFERQMQFLKRHNYNIVKLEELPNLVESGGVPYRTIAITFDDGYENNYTYAYPVLKRLELPATIFIVPALIGQEGYLTWAHVNEMLASGIISIGSHTMTHAWLPNLPEQELNTEIFDSKRAIESHTRREVISFSYPLGGFDEYVRSKVVRAGYKIAVATNPGREYPRHDPYAMKRLRISSTSDNLFIFWIETSGFYTWIKEIRDED